MQWCAHECRCPQKPEETQTPEWELGSYDWVLGTKLMSSAKAALALVHPALSPASLLSVFAMDFLNVCVVDYISLSFLA